MRMVRREGSQGGGGGNIIEGLIALVLSEKVGIDVMKQPKVKRNPAADAMRKQIRKDMDAAHTSADSAVVREEE